MMVLFESCKYLVFILTNHNNLCHLIDTRNPSFCHDLLAQKPSVSHFRIDNHQEKLNRALDALSCFFQKKQG